jgi:hypothetical protein
MKRILYMVLFMAMNTPQLWAQSEFEGRKFEQMGTMLPTPNSYRTASGSPGPEYWQQKADYQIEATLDEEALTISGEETITYHNNSPETLRYLWLQLEQNMRRNDSDTYSTAPTSIDENMSKRQIKTIVGRDDDLGYNIEAVTDIEGQKLPYTINKTMMRIDLPEPLTSGDKISFKVKWHQNINDYTYDRARAGYEYFEKDGNHLFAIAMWFPRMAVYDDKEGWQNKQFLGRGEFALPFGDYDVKLTVPADHIVGATGELQNPEEVLTNKQLELFEKAKTASDPVIIVSQEEVEQKEKTKVKGRKTWRYKAENVRDFAFTTSRKLIWGAMGVDIEGRTVMAMSYYPKEANPLYGEYSTKVVAHTLKVYSKYTIPYPYPVAISVEANKGMEYPMISFNYGRPDEDGAYPDRLKHGMISVIIHEVGHNFFPMIINSDERQWTWMDEGLNTFVQYLAQKEWDPDFPSRRGPAEKIAPYMKGSKDTMVPIMTNSEQIKQFGNNAYGKPATALNILRETIMGPELFDYAFKEYCRKWAFRHPSPADFFRTMEEASAVDLDWFWKGWFYTTDNVDIDLANVKWYKYDAEIDIEKQENRKNKKNRNGDKPNPFEDYEYINIPIGEGGELFDGEKNYYEMTFKNKGGLVMPVILKLNYKDGSTEIKRIPAEIWRKNEQEVTKVFTLNKELSSVELDPFKETADVNTSNNTFPRQEETNKFDDFVNKSAD